MLECCNFHENHTRDMPVGQKVGYYWSDFEVFAPQNSRIKTCNAKFGTYDIQQSPSVHLTQTLQK